MLLSLLSCGLATEPLQPLQLNETAPQANQSGVPVSSSSSSLLAPVPHPMKARRKVSKCESNCLDTYTDMQSVRRCAQGVPTPAHPAIARLRRRAQMNNCQTGCDQYDEGAMTMGDGKSRMDTGCPSCPLVHCKQSCVRPRHLPHHLERGLTRCRHACSLPFRTD